METTTENVLISVVDRVMELKRRARVRFGGKSSRKSHRNPISIIHNLVTQFSLLPDMETYKFSLLLVQTKA